MAAIDAPNQATAADAFDAFSKPQAAIVRSVDHPSMNLGTPTNSVAATVYTEALLQQALTNAPSLSKLHAAPEIKAFRGSYDFSQFSGVLSTFTSAGVPEDVARNCLVTLAADPQLHTDGMARTLARKGIPIGDKDAGNAITNQVEARYVIDSIRDLSTAQKYWDPGFVSWTRKSEVAPNWTGMSAGTFEAGLVVSIGVLQGKSPDDFPKYAGQYSSGKFFERKGDLIENSARREQGITTARELALTVASNQVVFVRGLLANADLTQIPAEKVHQTVAGLAPQARHEVEFAAAFGRDVYRQASQLPATPKDTRGVEYANAVGAPVLVTPGVDAGIEGRIRETQGNRLLTLARSFKDWAADLFKAKTEVVAQEGELQRLSGDYVAKDLANKAAAVQAALLAQQNAAKAAATVATTPAAAVTQPAATVAKDAVSVEKALQGDLAKKGWKRESDEGLKQRAVEFGTVLSAKDRPAIEKLPGLSEKEKNAAIAGAELGDMLRAKGVKPDAANMGLLYDNAKLFARGESPFGSKKNIAQAETALASLGYSPAEVQSVHGAGLTILQGPDHLTGMQKLAAA